MVFRWIHLSDFHFTASDPYDRNTVLIALLAEIERRRQAGFQADVVFATGDIAYSGKTAEYQSATAFFDALLQAANLDKAQLFVVPGNHDLDKEAGSGLKRTLDDEQESVGYFADGKPKYHFGKFQAFRDWFNGYFGKLRTCPCNSTCHEPETLLANGLRVAVLPVNTALFSLPDGNDHNRLWIGRRNLDAALDKLKALNAELSFALLHHPMDWLHNAECANIKAALQEQADIILRGHLHENEIASIADAHGGCLHLAAGACYQTRLYPNTALLCTVDLGKRELKIEPIHYADTPKPAWTPDTSLFLPPIYPDYIGRFSMSRPASTKHATSQQGQFANAIRQQIRELLAKLELEPLRQKLLAGQTDSEAVAVLLPETDVLDADYIETAIMNYHVAVESVRGNLLRSGTTDDLKSLLGWLVLLSVSDVWIDVHQKTLEKWQTVEFIELPLKRELGAAVVIARWGKKNAEIKMDGHYAEVYGERQFRAEFFEENLRRTDALTDLKKAIWKSVYKDSQPPKDGNYETLDKILEFRYKRGTPHYIILNTEQYHGLIQRNRQIMLDLRNELRYLGAVVIGADTGDEAMILPEATLEALILEFLNMLKAGK